MRGSNPVLGIDDCLIDAADCPRAPTILVMLGPFQFRARRTQMFKGPPHVRLIGLHRTQTK